MVTACFFARADAQTKKLAVTDTYATKVTAGLFRNRTSLIVLHVLEGERAKQSPTL